ncbi:MAG: T9SS C-terminal target domain-containing protein [Candidatus Zixiibacteriota bacterium]|nr:MAG: T9SS C-terminal target domain-containing protein [candidate division Zixibacteria bacterium]
MKRNHRFFDKQRLSLCILLVSLLLSGVSWSWPAPQSYCLYSGGPYPGIIYTYGGTHSWVSLWSDSSVIVMNYYQNPTIPDIPERGIPGYDYLSMDIYPDGGQAILDSLVEVLQSDDENELVSDPNSLLVRLHPNPFNPSTSLRYDLSAPGRIRLQVYDISGRLVSTLVDGHKSAGSHEITFDASSLPSGIYFARLQAGDFTQTQKLVLLK